jgi:signal transduction histidine kinase
VNFPIRARLAVLGALVVAAAVVSFSAVTYVTISGNLTSQVDANLAARNTSARGGGGPSDHGAPPASPSNSYERIDLASSGDTYVEVLDSTGAVQFCNGVLDGKSPAVGADVLRTSTTTLQYTTINPSPTVPVRIAVRREVGPDGDVSYIVAGQSLVPVNDQLARLRLTLLLGTLLSLAGASLLSWWIAGRGLRPLEHMATAAEEIGRTRDLSRRIAEPRSRDEVSSLARSFNGMLERLHDAYLSVEGALDAQRRFVAAASHELRTPLTTIRTNAEILEIHPDADPAIRQEAVADIASESERMYRLVTSLLTLARADSGADLSMRDLDLSQLVANVVRQARRIHPDREITLDAPTELAVAGADDALRQLLWILLDNAAKHTPPTAAIAVTLAPAGEAVTLRVADGGPGIPPQDLDRVFDRFYRSDPSRSGEGTGLGLSIARWIAGQHGGQITAANAEGGGAVFETTLPRRRPTRGDGDATSS